jgi:predicted GNAT family acetyltransferase
MAADQATQVEVVHDEANRRFEATVEGRLCVADYELRDGVMWMTHTVVPPAVGGRGIAAELVRVAL